MTYTIDRMIPGEDIAAVDARTRKALAGQGFGTVSYTHLTLPTNREV